MSFDGAAEESLHLLESEVNKAALFKKQGDENGWDLTKLEDIT